MKSTAKKLAVCAAALCLLACGTAVSAAAASPVSGLALSGVAMPWDQDVPAESIEAGSYTANMLLGSSQQLSPVVRPAQLYRLGCLYLGRYFILTVSNSGVVQAVGVGHHPHHRCRRQPDLCLHHRCLHGFFHDRYRDGPFPFLQHHLCWQLGLGTAAGAAYFGFPIMPPSP